MPKNCSATSIGSDEPASSQGYAARRARNRERLEWWAANRSSAPGALREEIERAFRLIALQPGVGARALNAKLVGVRRIHLSRVRNHLYYRVNTVRSAVEILALWHTSRGTGPRV